MVLSTPPLRASVLHQTEVKLAGRQCRSFTNFARHASVTGAQTRHALRDPRPNSAMPFAVFHSQAPRLLPVAPPQKTGRAPLLCRSNARCESQDEIGMVRSFRQPEVWQSRRRI